MSSKSSSGTWAGRFGHARTSAAWSIPKGECTDSDLLATARREFEEELGCPAPSTGLEELGAFRQPSGKVVWIWVAEGDLDAARCRSNTFELEWPRGSGRFIEVPEIDRAEWVDVARARSRLVRGQVAALDELVRRVRVNRPRCPEGAGVEAVPGVGPGWVETRIGVSPSR